MLEGIRLQRHSQCGDLLLLSGQLVIQIGDLARLCDGHRSYGNHNRSSNAGRPGECLDADSPPLPLEGHHVARESLAGRGSERTGNLLPNPLRSGSDFVAKQRDYLTVPVNFQAARVALQQMLFHEPALSIVNCVEGVCPEQLFDFQMAVVMH